MPTLYVATICLSAALLFLVEPLWARLILPHFGGAAAVWNTLLVFYQAVLLAAYVSAHWVNKLAPKRMMAAQGLVLAGAVCVLPLSVGGARQAEGQAWAVLTQSVLVLAPVFFALATTNPLVQRLYAHAHPDRDPYPLYAASNAGSLIGLVLFPLLEYGLSMTLTRWLWSAGVLIWITLIVAILARHHGVARATRLTPPPTVLPRTAGARWFALALVPSAALVAESTWLSSAVAAAPLVWMLPVAAYIGSFIVVFSVRRPPQAVLQRVFVVAMVVVTVLLALGADHPTLVVVPLHIVAFFALCCVCHGQLALAAPPPEHLTLYYVVQSSGGVAGGLLAALVAPQLLVTPAEYPLVLVAAVVVCAERPVWSRGWLVVPVPAMLLFVACRDGELRTAGVAAAALGVYAMSGQAAPFAAALSLVLAVATWLPAAAEGELRYATRSFYGLHRVTDDGAFRQLRHGVTVHGRQRLDERDRCTPQLYYHQTGPIGQVFAHFPLTETATVGVVGEGTGCLACYGKPRQSWVFFEIDRAVDALARDPANFTYLANAPVAATTVIGDGRVTLAAHPAKFDVLVLDAYASDSIPLHLLTLEAMRLYAAHLTDRGILALHLSNRYFDLVPVVASLAQTMGYAVLLNDDGFVRDTQWRQGKSESLWMVVAAQPATLSPLQRLPQWRVPQRLGPVWRDDQATALDVLDLR